MYKKDKMNLEQTLLCLIENYFLSVLSLIIMTHTLEFEIINGGFDRNLDL